jgi:hypothetical protein
MATDIRINIGFFSHPKTRKLRRALGDAGVVALIEFWCYVAINRPKGNLDGLGEDDIEIAANWQGTPGAFYAQLFALRWICTDDDGILHVHGWEQHNPWAFSAPERIGKAKQAAKARWDKRLGDSVAIPSDATSNAKPMLLASSSITKPMLSDASSNAPSPVPSPVPVPLPVPVPSPIPSPIPSPSPIERETLSDESLTHAHGRAHEAGPRSTPEVPQKSEVFERWWALYPGKGSKQAALKAWDKATKRAGMDAVILDATLDQVKRHQELSLRGSWVPLWRHGSTWLNQSGWEDDALPERIETRQGTRADANRHALAAWIGGTDDKD